MVQAVTSDGGQADNRYAHTRVATERARVTEASFVIPFARYKRALAVVLMIEVNEISAMLVSSACAHGIHNVCPGPSDTRGACQNQLLGPVENGEESERFSRLS